MKQKLKVTFFTICMPVFLVAQLVPNSAAENQKLPNIVPPSPTVANLMSFEEVPVSYYTGKPDINIPIFNKKLNNDLAISIGLSYSTQGIKVTERSGWTGTGWNLMAGGSIGRTVMDLPDETESQFTYLGEQGVYQNGYYDYGSMAPEEKQEFNWRSNRGSERFDTQPDLYQFNFMGLSGRFVIIKDGSVLKAKQIGEDSKLKITFDLNQGSNTNEFYNSILSFTVTDTKGYSYLFESREKTYSEYVPTTTSQDGSISHNSIGGNVPKEYFSAWHLTRILSSNGQEIMSVDYHSPFGNTHEIFTTPISVTYNSFLNALDRNIYAFNDEQMYQSYNNGVLPPYSSGGFNYIKVEALKPSTISFMDGTSISFGLDPSHPEYLVDQITNQETGCKLSSIQLHDTSNSVVENYDLNYTETNEGRLFLDELIRSSGGVSHPYTFSYTDRDLLPGFDSPEKDLWGYYRSSNTGCLPSLSQQDALTGSLSGIEYPTGGIKKFVFEENTFSYIGENEVDPKDIENNYTNINSGGTMSGQINFTTAGFVTGLEDFIWFYQEGNNSVQIQNNVVGPTDASLDLNEYELIKYRAEAPIGFDPNGTYDENYFDGLVYNYSGAMDLNDMLCVPHSEGIYFFKLKKKNGIDINDQGKLISIDMAITHQKYVPVTNNMRGGGLRIKSIVFEDPTDSNIKVKTNYDYTLRQAIIEENGGPIPLPTLGLRSSGSYDGTLVHDFTYDVYKDFYLFSGSSYVVRNIGFKVRTPKNREFKMTKGSYIGYKSVTVTKDTEDIEQRQPDPLHTSLDTDLGYTIYEYTSPIDFPIVPNLYAYPFGPLEDLDYKRGLLQSVAIFDRDNRILKRETYAYNDIFDPYAVAYRFNFDATSQDCYWNQFYNTYNHMIQKSPEKNEAICLSGGTLGGVPCLNSTQYSNCPDAADYASVDAFYTNGRSELERKDIFEYFYDENGSQSVKESREEFLYNTDNQLISQKDSYYDLAGTEEHLRTKYYYPVGASLGSNTTFVRNGMAALNKIGALLETQTFLNGTKTSETHNIYGEFDTDQYLLKEVSIGKGSSLPEKRIEFHEYDVHGNPLEVSKADGMHISYIYGFNATLPVAKLENAKYADIQNIAGNGLGSSGNLSSSAEDNLRNGLAGSLISFYRYDPIKGLISTSDTKVIQTFFEYDDFGRLLRVLDEDANIISENHYNYRNQY